MMKEGSKRARKEPTDYSLSVAVATLLFLSAASIKGGVLIDLGLFREVTVGAGAKCTDVSKVLDEKSLAVVGGRTSAVGVAARLWE